MSDTQFVVPDGAEWAGHSTVFETLPREVERLDRNLPPFVNHMVFDENSKIIAKFFLSAADSALFVAAASSKTGLAASHATIRDLQAQLAEAGERLRRMDRRTQLLYDGITTFGGSYFPVAEMRKIVWNAYSWCRFCGLGTETGEPLRTTGDGHEHAGCADGAEQ